ncbi:hypothetical protein DFH09DRAFT_1073126 [Mycena vulgaris]|nr:hypothetical protein DFH09DRAFT_1073126 [Mycena vulgaris]
MFLWPSLLVISVFMSDAVVADVPCTPPVASVPTSPQCCTSVVNTEDAAARAVADLLGLCLTNLLVPIGLSCSPIAIVGNNCGSTTVICTPPQQEWGGLIAINCIPITL